jgi:hypothetical protein
VPAADFLNLLSEEFVWLAQGGMLGHIKAFYS